MCRCHEPHSPRCHDSESVSSWRRECQLGLRMQAPRRRTAPQMRSTFMGRLNSGMPPNGFSDLGLDDTLIATLSSLGYEEATPIQREAIPPLIEGKDLL